MTDQTFAYLEAMVVAQTSAAEILSTQSMASKLPGLVLGLKAAIEKAFAGQDLPGRIFK